MDTNITEQNDITIPTDTATGSQEVTIEPIALFDSGIEDNANANTASLVANNDDIPNSLMNEAIIISPDILLANDTDPNDGLIIPSSIGDAVNGTVTFDSVNVIFTPTQDYTGPASFTYTITNAQGELDTATVNLTINAPDTSIENQAPIALDNQIPETDERVITIAPSELLANDSDPDGDTISAVSVQDAVNGSVMFDGTNVIFTADDGYTGPASFMYTITDNNGANDTATVNLMIKATDDSPASNQAPNANDDQVNGNINSDGSYVIAPILLLANDSDPDGDAISAVSVQGAVNGSVMFDGTNVIFTADEGYTGPASFMYSITDNKGGMDMATANLMIEDGNTNPIQNEAPIASDDSIPATSERVIIIAPSTLLANDSDPDGDAISGISIQDTTNGAAIYDGAQVVFIPDDGYTGPASFTYSITDNDGATDTATVNLMINSANPLGNQAPIASDDSIPATSERVIVIAPSTLLANDSDPDGDAISGISIQDSTNGAAIYNGAEVVFIPDDGYTGPASFTYTISDKSGKTDTATVNLMIESDGLITNQTPITSEELDSETDAPTNLITQGESTADNQAPTASDDSLPETDARVIVIAPSTLTANDNDPDGDAIAGISIQDASNGTAIYDGANVIFVADDGYTGPASFTYTITDNDGATDTATVNLMIESSNALGNQAPTASDDSIPETDARVIVIAPSTLTANDNDPDGDAITGISIQGASNGTAIYDGANVIFVADDGYTGPATFTYTISDKSGKTDTATVNLMIAPATDSPSTEIIGDKADNQLLGTEEDNLIFGDQGNDEINGLAGNDRIQGGQGNDILEGGAGSDTFVWGYDAINTFGNGLETDIINNFTVEDKIDLRGLLQNIISNDPNAPAEEQLITYLSFSYDATATANGGTVISISALGSFNPDDQLQYGDQRIIIDGVDWTQGGTLEDIDILRILVENNTLITDAPGRIEGNPSFDTSQAKYNETLTGDESNNQLNGGRGDDIIMAGNGDDVIQGGQGNDQLDGGAGADTFVWGFNDVQPWGNGRETDIIHNISIEDTLDFRDLLQNEQSIVDVNLSAAERLDAYFNFTYDATAAEQGGTIMAVSALGSFSGNDSQQLGDQTIVFSGTDLTQGGSLSDVAIIQNMLNNGNLLTDVIV